MKSVLNWVLAAVGTVNGHVLDAHSISGNRLSVVGLSSGCEFFLVIAA